MFQQYTSVCNYDAVASRRFTNALSYIQVNAFDAGFLFQTPYALIKTNREGIQGVYSPFYEWGTKVCPRGI